MIDKADNMSAENVYGMKPFSVSRRYNLVIETGDENPMAHPIIGYGQEEI